MLQGEMVPSDLSQCSYIKILWILMWQWAVSISSLLWWETNKVLWIRWVFRISLDLIILPHLEHPTHTHTPSKGFFYSPSSFGITIGVQVSHLFVSSHSASACSPTKFLIIVLDYHFGVIVTHTPSSLLNSEIIQDEDTHWNENIIFTMGKAEDRLWFWHAATLGFLIVLPEFEPRVTHRKNLGLKSTHTCCLKLEEPDRKKKKWDLSMMKLHYACWRKIQSQ
jgi:hypothetical protein